MKDRLIFEKRVLGNGITVFSYPMDVPYASIHLIIPLGHVHNIGRVVPGSFHFLEHMIMDGFKKYPEKNSFGRFVGLKGGAFNAATSLFHTKFELHVPQEIHRESFEGFLNNIFQPILTEEDIALERGIIANERRREEPYFPGGDSLSRHIMTEWKYAVPVTLRQMFGEDSDHSLITEATLKDAHRGHLNSDMHVFIGGSFDCNSVQELLAKVTVCQRIFPSKYHNIGWHSREFHVYPCEDISRHIYSMGGVFPVVDVRTSIAINFIGQLLTNNVHGVLYRWLREEKGWIYEVCFEYNLNKIDGDWEIQFPLNSLEEVDIVRKEIHEKIVSALKNDVNVSHEVERRKSESVFCYQTLNDVLEYAQESLSLYGVIFSEKQIRAFLDECKDIKYLMSVYEKYFSPQVIGEFVAVPDR